MSKHKQEVRQIQATELRVATNDNGQRTLTGYAAVFNSVSVDMGGWVELVAPTAFTRTLEASPDVLCLYAHDTSLVLGRTTSATLKLTIDPKGLRFDVILPDTSTAADLIVLIERGDISGCSFGFVTQADVWSEDSTGRYIRTLLDVDLYEITITSSPAYTDTSVSLRSAPKEIRSKITNTEKRNAGCNCQCPECLDDDCDECSNSECDDLNCGECRSKRYAPKPVETSSIADADESDSRDWKAMMEIRLKLLALASK